MSFLRFLIYFILLSAGCGFIFFLLDKMAPGSFNLVPKFWVIFGFLFCITIIAYGLSLAGLKRAGESSAFILIGAITVKMLFSMGFVLAYLLKISVNGVDFALQFFSLYFLFTAFEVYALLCNLRDQSKS